jgi:general secretion pathway protein D
MVYQLDRPEPQVMIQALIAEVALNDTLDLGLEFAAQDLLFSEKAVLGPNGVLKGPDFDFVGGTDLGTSNIGGGFSFATTGEDFNLLFRALQTNSKIEVLSRPTIMVRNNEEASIVLGDRVPTISGTQINPQGSTSSTVEYNEVGIKLTVQPTINPDGYVTLSVEPEISAQTEDNIQLTEGLSAPVFRERSANTLVTVRDGETVVIGGLITDSRTDGETKVPLLGDIPILGWLGKSTGKTITKTELLIVLTVDVMWSDEDLQEQSVKERDRGELPAWIKNSPLMEGLQILPEEGEGMGPEELDPGYSDDVEEIEFDSPREDADYGPRPGSYGPQVPQTVRVSHAVLPEVEIGMGYGPTPPEKLRLASAGSTYRSP